MGPLLRRISPMMILLTCVTLTGCATQPPPEIAPAADESADGARRPQAAERRQSTEEPLDAGRWDPAAPSGETVGLESVPDDYVLQTIYFDYDESEVRTDQRDRLQANARYLREHGGVRILISGHADERGTREYNMALGEQRANSTMRYLVALGIPRERIEIVSYGEEQPVVTGESESSYAQNRRAEFRVVTGR